MMDPAIENRPARATKARSRSQRLATAFSCMFALAPALLGCETRDQVSVGELPCDDDERVLCESHTRETLEPVLVETNSESESVAQIVWQHELGRPSECETGQCVTTAIDFLVHDDGELTLVSSVSDENHTEFWVSWLDADGQELSTTRLPEDYPGTQLTLNRDVEGAPLLLAVHQSTLRAYAIARSGRVDKSFEVEMSDKGDGWPGSRTLPDGDVVVARRPSLSPGIEISRYRRNERLWRQTRIASLPGQSEVGLSFPDDTPLELRTLAVDRRERVWVGLSEGLLGIAQLDPDGLVGWHGLLLWPPPLSSDAEEVMIIDGRDRPIYGYGNDVLRLEPDGSGEERSMPLLSSALYEQFYPPAVHALAVDAQDRIYVATHDGPRTAHRIVVDRISEDFSARTRFALALPAAQAQDSRIDGLLLGSTGDLYARIVFYGLAALAETTPPSRIVRLHLVEP